MPALDQCEPNVINALTKEDWQVTDQPFAVKIVHRKRGFVYADLRPQHKENKEQIIVVEVKCFAENRMFWEDFYHAVGQYIVYRHPLAPTVSIHPFILPFQNTCMNHSCKTRFPKAYLTKFTVK